MQGLVPDPALLYGHLLGTVLFCLVFLYLRRESGTVYFGYWSLAWAAEALALLSALRFFASGATVWLSPWAGFEFAFALTLVAAARSQANPQGVRIVGSALTLLLGFPLFLLLVFLTGTGSTFAGYHALHTLVMCGFFLFTYFDAPGIDAPGAKMFRIALILLAVTSWCQASIFFYVHVTGRSPGWASLYVPYHPLVDFALQATLAFAAITMWIGQLNQRVRKVTEELMRLQKRTSRSQDIDSLTGLLNQASLSRRLESQAGFVGAVTVCDLDSFKAVNDRHGHMVGDELLSNIGHLIRSSIRKEDEAFRWGGDEFVIIFYDGNLPMVQARMHQLQERLLKFQVRGLGLLPITMSWGAAEAAGRSLREVLDQADRQMYAMKRANRGV